MRLVSKGINFLVFPAKAGTQGAGLLDSRFRGNDDRRLT
jgi:hypothetical protein